MFIKVTDSNNVPYFVNINNISSFAWFEKDNLTLFMLSTGRSNAKETPEQILQMIQDEHTAREVAVREAILETPISSMFEVTAGDSPSEQATILLELSGDVIDDWLEEKPPRHALGSLFARIKALLATLKGEQQ